MIMPTIKVHGISDRGLKRSHNEDICVVRAGLGFCLVADGMGGAAAGEVASRIFAEAALEVFSGYDRRLDEKTIDIKGKASGATSEVFANNLKELGDETLKLVGEISTDNKRPEPRTIHMRTDEETVESVRKCFYLANLRIQKYIKENTQHTGMGCTAELIAFSKHGFVLGHVGDSRTYRYRHNALKQLTQDHSLVQIQIDKGIISPEEAKNHSLRNVILRCLGSSEKLKLDLIRGQIFAGDLFLLCSDGLTDMVDDSHIQQILSSNIDLWEKNEQLINLAKDIGGLDNVTVVLAEILQP